MEKEKSSFLFLYVGLPEESRGQGLGSHGNTDGCLYLLLGGLVGASFDFDDGFAHGENVA